MLQIAILGIAFMLVVKGLDVLHQDRLAAKAGHISSPKLATGILVLALVFAAILFFSSVEQATQMPTAPSFGTP